MFIVQYMSGLIELRDLSKEADPILSFQIPHDEEESLMQISDIDMKGDETNLLVGFNQHKIARLNLRTGEFVVQKIEGWDGNIGKLLTQVSFIQSLPGSTFFVYTRDGSTYLVDEFMKS